MNDGEYHNAHLKKVHLKFPDSYGLRLHEDMVWRRPDGNLFENHCSSDAKIVEVKVQTIYSEEPSTGSLYLLYPNLLLARMHTVMFADGYAARSCQLEPVDVTFWSHSRIERQSRASVDIENECAPSDDPSDSEGNEKKRHGSSEKRTRKNGRKILGKEIVKVVVHKKTFPVSA